MEKLFDNKIVIEKDLDSEIIEKVDDSTYFINMPATEFAIFRY